MRIVILHARGDVAADEVVVALRHEDILRFAIGVHPVDLRLGDVQVVVVWSRQAAELGWERFTALTSEASAMVAVLIGDIEAPAGAPASVRWDRTGEGRLTSLLSDRRGEAEVGGGALGGMAKGAAAGLVAAVGVLAAGAGPAVSAMPIAVSRREDQSQAKTTAPQAQSAIKREAPSQSVVAAINLDRPSQPLTSEQAAEALALELVQSLDVSVPPAPARKGPAFPKLVDFNVSR